MRKFKASLLLSSSHKTNRYLKQSTC